MRPLLVANPWARQLTFLDDRTRTRRDHVKYLTLIRTLALLHQYQRETKTVMHRGELVPYIEVTLADIAVANTLAHQVLGRSLDELAPQTRRLLLALDEMVRGIMDVQKLRRSEVRFTRKDVRGFTGWGQTQLRLHLDRLIDLEYVAAHHGKQGQGYVYELLYDGQGQDGRPFLSGLIDVTALEGAATTGSSRGERGHFAGERRGEIGPEAGPSRAADGRVSSGISAEESRITAIAAENAHLETISAGARRTHLNGAVPAVR